MRILVADDAGDQREIIERLLDQWGHEALVARDGLEAWEILRHEPVRLVLSDWMMPGIDGVELCRRIRAHGADRRAYVILLTGRDNEEDLITALEAGADDVLTKPFRFEELAARLRAAESVLDQEADGRGVAADLNAPVRLAAKLDAEISASANESAIQQGPGLSGPRTD
ncbi:response regulator with CheY-like receiver domain and winged-helix DNA-binding domain [Thioflavicoccus mobilis 8321]|uniref:Response regulator with CheY-like receiver domain and winged-helix DNA-binding domain n=1 Tax=Thioflavicoccus mobilis 8321 TaxID=765912 RepID=L0GVN7_9GAMM|nr:response regulator [Thioflavicoccus mobilis]AGA89364.1 response regulator with CheY-like receiver domain and winged-helix DNA-binding domain [Thioflavicoccus mobilis 8321]